MPFKSFKKTGKKAGFSLVELVAIITILGIIAAFALPRYFNLGSYQERSDYDEIAGALRYAQKLAVGSGCDVQVVFTGTSYSLQQRATSCTTGAFATISGHPISSGTISGNSLSSVPSSFIFNSMGRCSAAATITVGSRTIRVIRETGTVDAS